MSERTTKEKTSRSRQSGKDPSILQIRTAYDDLVLNMEFAALLLTDKAGNFPCLICNKPLLPYQEPFLPFYRTIPGFHGLLAGLKTAQTFLFLQFQSGSAILPEEFLYLFPTYASDAAYPNLESRDAYVLWKQSHPKQPLLLSAFEIVDANRERSYIDFQLTSLDSSRPDYSRTFSHLFYQPLIAASLAYNESIQRCFDAGIIVIPYNLSTMPEKEFRELPCVDI